MIRDTKNVGSWVAVGAVIVLIWWLWKMRMREKTAAHNSADQGIPTLPATPMIYNGQPTAFTQVPSEPTTNEFSYSINAGIPNLGFAYSGNSQIYMPLFGFVGFSDTGGLQ
jgi:hypothetical protein